MTPPSINPVDQGTSFPVYPQMHCNPHPVTRIPKLETMKTTTRIRMHSGTLQLMNQGVDSKMRKPRTQTIEPMKKAMDLLPCRVAVRRGQTLGRLVVREKVRQREPPQITIRDQENMSMRESIARSGVILGLQTAVHLILIVRIS